MKIKELHLRNIASIEKADIDFEVGLNDKLTDTPASIFLISGDTGTGKSVLLDAIAMALYKKTPRVVGVVNRSNNDFTDEQGETISINSIEQYTRLGISVKDECYSEVVFEGNDSREYRARLTLGMAKTRDKDENGNYRLKHRSPIWQVKIGSNDWQNVEARSGEPIFGAIGLTFEQFGRMAMLAQGQFASFLIGDKKERESILEQLTNTEHFTRYGEAINRIFKRAEEGKKNAQNKLEIESEHTLSEQEVTAQRQRFTELETEEKALSEQISIAENKILQIEKLEQNNDAKTKQLEQKKLLEAETWSAEYKDMVALVRDWEKTSTERQRVTDKKVAEKKLEEAKVEEVRIKGKFIQLTSDLKAREMAIAEQKAAVEAERLWLGNREGRDTLYTTYLETKAQVEHMQQLKRNQEEIARKLERERGKSAYLEISVNSLKTKAKKIGGEVKAYQDSLETIIEERKRMNPEEVSRNLITVTREKSTLLNLQERFERLLVNIDKIANEKADIEKESKELELLKIGVEEKRKSFDTARKKSEEANARLITMGESLNDTLVSLRRRLVVEHEEHCPLCGQRLETIYAEEDFRGILTPIEQEQRRLAEESYSCESAYNTAKRKHDTADGALAAKAKQLEASIKGVEKDKSAIGHELMERGLEVDGGFVAEHYISVIGKLIKDKEDEEQKLKQQQILLEELQSKLNTLLYEKKLLDEKKTEADRLLVNAENNLKNNADAIVRLCKEQESVDTNVHQQVLWISEKIEVFYPNWQSDIEATLVTLIADAQLYIEKKNIVEKKVREIEKAQNVADTLRSHYDLLHTEYPECEQESSPILFDCRDIQVEWVQLIGEVNSLKEKVKANKETIDDCNKTLAAYYAETLKDEAYLISLNTRKDELDRARKHINVTNERLRSHTDAIIVAEEHISAALAALGVTDADNIPNKVELLNVKQEANNKKNDVVGQKGAVKQKLDENNQNIERRNKAERELATAMALYNRWEMLNRYFGGTRFRTLVQTYVLRPLLNNANIYLEQITDRYKLTCSEDNAQLSILVHDLYNKGNVRSATILSGGERFMISLALSLALSSLNRPDMNINILFIDEGFGTLDEKSLDSVMSTLEKLQEIAGQSNRRVGVISHREELNERIPVQIQVKRRGEGRSVVEITKN